MNLYNVSEVEISYKPNIQIKDRLYIGKPEDAYKILHNHWDQNKIDFIEQSKLLLLNHAHHVLGISHLSTGGVTETLLDPRLIFVTALKANATSLILAHNHPSGALKPSQADIDTTKRLQEAGKLLCISVIEHIIVANDGFYSFSDQLAYEKVQRHSGVYYEAVPPF